MKLLIVREYHEGEYELRGEKYTSVEVFDLEKLNEKCHKKCLELLPKWKDELGEDIVPVNGGDTYTYHDLIEEAYDDNGDYSLYEDVFCGGEQEFIELDFKKAKKHELSSLYNIINHKHSDADSYFTESVLEEHFSWEEIHELRVNISFRASITATLNGIEKSFNK